MKGDFSRDTFNGRKHYGRVLMQQGRVQVDADPNEQVAIDDHIDTATTYDVIGQSGVPLALLPDGTPAGGFQITLNADGSDLTISRGRMYVEGELVENDLHNATFLHQPDRPFPSGTTLANLADLAAGAGTYVVYLDVWERLVTALDDALIRETALGGPDTSVRAKLLWQAKLARTGAVDPSATCDSVGNAWRPQTANQGTLAAQTGAPQVDQLPCILPPETGYRRLENQLYRVEIHQAGTYGTAMFEWSRENGSVVAGVMAPPGPNPPTTVIGPTFSVTTVGRDSSLGFKPGDWVELIDDRGELLAGHGELLQVQTVDPAGLTITTKTAAANPVDLSLHPKLRRWDQTGDGLGGGITIADGSWIKLEDGVQVQFSSGQFNVGDYWLIPARTKTSVQGGHIEWPVDSANNPLALPPRGIIHHYAKLALVAFDGKRFQNVGNSVPDCRPSFPPLTSIQPSQPAVSPCTIVVAPGPGWEKPLLALFKDGALVDAEICFPVGNFPAIAPVAIRTTGNVKVCGAGFGTRLVGKTLESVLRFEGCASVVVRDLFAVTSAVDAPNDPARKHVNGTLEFHQCQEVSVENVSVQCGSGPIRGAACLTVVSDITDQNAATGSGSVRIRDSRFQVGEMQFGILLVHVARATIEDNEIDIGAATVVRRPFPVRLQDPIYQAMARSVLLSHLTVGARSAGGTPPTAGTPPRTRRAGRQPVGATGAAAPTGAAAAGPAGAAAERSNVTLTIGNRVVSFLSHPGLQSTWQTFIDRNAPKEFATDRDLIKFMASSAARILADPTARQQLAGFSDVIHFLEQQEVPVAARGIAVVGRAAQDLHIRNNSINGAMQAITAGMSHREPKPGTPDRAHSVRIVGNVIDVILNSLARKTARHAIFVGNVESLQIEENRAKLTAPASLQVPSDGIRVFGYLGKKMIVRQNHLSGFSPGILVDALLAPGKSITTGLPYQAETRPGNLWLIADNVFEGGSRTPIHAPACAIFDNVY